MTLPFGTILLRLALAALLAGIAGFERELHHRELAAGLRTQALVGVGACLIMITSAFGFADILATQHVTLDPSRIAAQVVSGIGFLGAGIIIFRHHAVHGLTTAATVWVSAALGLAVGGGLYAAAVAATAIALCILVLLRAVTDRIPQRKPYGLLKIAYNPVLVRLSTLHAAVEAAGLKSLKVHVKRDRDGAQMESTLEQADFHLAHPDSNQVVKLLSSLLDTHGVLQATSTDVASVNHSPVPK